uniref:Sema domain-containing protein n=1 Tax=Octopus bimaculoides TaxID=37653 RepID=A0A0L8H1G8_OCTBM
MTYKTAIFSLLLVTSPSIIISQPHFYLDFTLHSTKKAVVLGSTDQKVRILEDRS